MGLQYQDFLLDEFKVRRSRNPNYSLRAFARDLGMPASKLSQNLRGLCGISVAKAESIADKIQMRDDDRRLFLALVESQHARSRVARQQALKSLERITRDKIAEISLEKFSEIRDWYYMAILEMTRLKSFSPEIAWMAQKLDLPKDIVGEAVKKLEDLGLLKIEDGQIRAVESDFELPSGPPARSVREHHRQILTKAMVAIDKVTVEDREFTTQTFAISRKLIPEVRRRMREFQREIARMAQGEENDEVLALSLQLFPLLEKEP